ncbi:MAG TPA: hypothetical protein VHB21_22650, partial [Minicystis sp.]|nr:hypothetical protein [Minicystis sp.]
GLDDTRAAGRGDPHLEGAGGSGGGASWSIAPHAAPMTAASLGGPLMPAQRLVPVYFDGDDAAFTARIDAFLSALVTSRYYADAAGAYGIGAPSLAPAAHGGAAPASIDDADVASWVASNIASGALPPRTDETVYVLFYPAATTVTLWGMTSCVGFGGYHLSADLGDGTRAVYAVVPRCADDSGAPSLDELTVSTTHELFEAATDPFDANPAYTVTDNAHSYWGSILGAEVGDLCDLSPDGAATFPDLPYRVQRIYSNASALAGHDPCVPIPDGQVYFNASPDPQDDLGGEEGLLVPVGGSATIAVDLFSDGPIDAWQVKAFDVRELMGQPPHLAFAFDRDTGENGDHLELTITTTDTAPGEVETYVLYSVKDGRANPWVGVVETE